MSSDAQFIGLTPHPEREESVLVHVRHAPNCQEAGQEFQVSFSLIIVANYGLADCGCEVVVPIHTWMEWHKRYRFCQRLEGKL